MIDIDASLRDARSLADAWTTGNALEVSSRLERIASAKLDWDTGAGENWIRVVRHDHVLALISTVLPLAFVEASLTPSKLQLEAMVVVEVPNMDSELLCATSETLQYAFGDSTRLDSISEDRFSVQDLWYATV